MDRQTRLNVEERVITITEVDMASLTIVARDQFNTPLRLSMQFFDPILSVPQVNERWTVQRKGNEWFLARRANMGTEAVLIKDLQPGDSRIEANNLYLNATSVILSSPTKTAFKSQLSIYPQGFVTLAFPGSGGTINIDASLGDVFYTNATASTWTYAAPTNPTIGQRITLMVLQTGFGTATITLNAVYKKNTTWGGSQANGAYGTISFIYNGAAWIETSRTSNIT